MARLTKNYSVFDCDAHITDPIEIWNYIPENKKEFMQSSGIWADRNGVLVNGRLISGTSGAAANRSRFNAISITGPGLTSKKVLRRLATSGLTPEQSAYLNQKGAYYPKDRVRDLDLMGIDQVLLIPSVLIQQFPFVENVQGAKLFCEAYNNFVADWCSEAPDRLYPAAMLPIQNPNTTTEELRRVAQKGFRVGLIRPIDANGTYPNRVLPVIGSQINMDVAFRAFEELGMVVGIHGLTSTPAPPPGPLLFSPGQYILKANELEPMRALASQPTSFWYECMAWTAQILMSGFFDRYPKLKMAMFECNASWIPQLLESCDRLFDIYKNERLQPAKRKPSEAFYDQCIIGFESDEIDVLRQWDRFENIAVWASDTYHWDGSDAWTAIKEMSELEVPEPVQAKLMGANAAQRYGIPQKMLVREAPSKLDHPSWVPREDDPSLDEWWEKETHPRKYSGVQHTSTPRGGY